ncbi:MAG: trxA [Parachlamydiales bacterium]|nr:trxA [Parachlamydiales bacterium]
MWAALSYEVLKLGESMSDKGLIKHLTDDSFKKEVATGVTLVDFHADWCGPCRMLAPVLEQLSLEMLGKASIAKVDIDSEQKTAAEFQITSVPTLILFKNGKEVNRLIGLRNAEAVKNFLLSAV